MVTDVQLLGMVDAIRDAQEKSGLPALCAFVRALSVICAAWDGAGADEVAERLADALVLGDRREWPYVGQDVSALPAGSALRGAAAQRYGAMAGALYGALYP